jgi:hypothetical protein
MMSCEIVGAMAGARHPRVGRESSEGNKNKSSTRRTDSPGRSAQNGKYFLLKFPSTAKREQVFPSSDDESTRKKLHSSRDNNAQIGNFPIYDKI